MFLSKVVAIVQEIMAMSIKKCVFFYTCIFVAIRHLGIRSSVERLYASDLARDFPGWERGKRKCDEPDQARRIEEFSSSCYRRG
jgi:hypothetical protein